MRQFGDKQFDPRGLIQRKIIRRHAGNAKQLSDDTFMHIAILPQIQRRQMETKYLHRADEPRQCAPARQRAITVAGEARRHSDKVPAQFVRAVIGLS